MVEQNVVERLMRAFPNSFIIYNGEIILHKKANVYFNIFNCENELDVKCKVLEWCSRAADKGQPYVSERSNNQFRDFILNGINEFLGTQFTKNDMDYIYTYLGNAIKHDKTIEFIKQNYNMSFFRQFER